MSDNETEISPQTPADTKVNYCADTSERRYWSEYHLYGWYNSYINCTKKTKWHTLIGFLEIGSKTEVIDCSGGRQCVCDRITEATERAARVKNTQRC